jgi:hypothetical protein
MKPHLAKNDLELFYKYLYNDNVKTYFEYGSGGSTFQALKSKNIQRIFSVESDLSWYNKLKKVVKENDEKEKSIYLIYNEMNAKPNNWGNPGPKSTNKQKINYSNQLLLLGENVSKNIDLLFIDGRFRVSCCLKSYNLINDDCLIIFDDFLNRPFYHIVLNYFQIIDNTTDNRMVVLKKIPNLQIPQELIHKYQLIPN